MCLLQEHERARRRAECLDGIDRLIAEDDHATARTHIQRALQVRCFAAPVGAALLLQGALR